MDFQGSMSRFGFRLRGGALLTARTKCDAVGATILLPKPKGTMSAIV